MNALTHTPPHKGLPVRLGARELLMPRLSFGGFADCQQRFKAIADQSLSDPVELQAAFIDVLLAAFRRNYPSMERRELEDALDWDTAPELFQQLLAFSVPSASVGGLAEAPAGAPPPPTEPPAPGAPSAPGEGGDAIQAFIENLAAAGAVVN
jgi:hypothetical protein